MKNDRAPPGQLAGMQNERTIRESWLRIGGEWWYTPLD